ncbi:hypothetical protein AVEN_86094-1 [Araneus ventricosus]|uniref:Uncharacterized protein n=1 Tax=Araneus ventricosus TaxID=182803 RepID=A0A4Y2LF33_ARAVE|nr:hypothetical protein AVEN_86094-1 [Araneus ventricosus]
MRKRCIIRSGSENNPSCFKDMHSIVRERVVIVEKFFLEFSMNLRVLHLAFDPSSTNGTHTCRKDFKKYFWGSSSSLPKAQPSVEKEFSFTERDVTTVSGYIAVFSQCCISLFQRVSTLISSRAP